MRRLPARPSIPPIAWFAVAMWVGCIAGESLSWARFSRTGTSAPLTGSAAAAVVVIVLVARGRRNVRALAALVLAGALAGSTVSALAGAEWQRRSAVASECGARSWSGFIEADPLPGSFGTTVRVRVTGGPLDGARVRVGWPERTSVPELGRTVRFRAILKPLSADEPWARRAARGGASATGNAWHAQVGKWRPGIAGPLLAWRAEILSRMHDILGPGGALLEGIVLGDRRRLIGTSAEEDFRALGLSHLVAVSGSHLALACGAVALVGRGVGLRKRALVIVTVVAGTAYAVVTGMPYSALRSLLMLVLAGAGQLSGRRVDGLASLSAAAIAVLCLDPWAVFDVGFQLSALAVGGLLLFGGLATAWIGAALGERARVVGGVLALTCVAQAGTVAISASTFGMLSVLAPIANAVAAPLVSVALWLGLGGAVVSTVLPAVGAIALRAATTVLEATAWIASLMAGLPGAAVVLGTGVTFSAAVVGLGAAVWMRWPLPRTRKAARRVVGFVVVGSVALALGPAPARSCSMIALDVGQGDAILVRDGGRAMLVDAGADATRLRKALAGYGLRRIDALVLTHAHDDHTAGARGLGSVMEIGWVGVPNGGGQRPADVKTLLGVGADVRLLDVEDAWRIGNTRVRVLWPAASGEDELSTNDTSVVLEVSHGSFDAVLTGDAESAPQEALLADGALRAVEVLKVPHHGSTNGLTVEALKMWSPQVSVISVGAKNDFGHPAARTLGMLHSQGVRIWRTDEVGDVVVRVRRTGFTVSGERRSAPSAVHGTIRARQMWVVMRPVSRSARSLWERLRGSQEHRGSEARLPDSREGRPAARARPPPSSRARSGGRRSRLQLRRVRRRNGGCH